MFTQIEIIPDQVSTLISTYRSHAWLFAFWALVWTWSMWSLRPVTCREPNWRWRQRREQMSVSGRWIRTSSKCSKKIHTTLPCPRSLGRCMLCQPYQTSLGLPARYCISGTWLPIWRAFDSLRLKPHQPPLSGILGGLALLLFLHGCPSDFLWQAMLIRECWLSRWWNGQGWWAVPQEEGMWVTTRGSTPF